jgi:hypothetical protein
MRSWFIEVLRAGRARAVALLLLTLALALPRLTALDRYVTVDEPLWLMRSANFYEALWNEDWKNTYLVGHPGVSITWAGTAGFLWEFPGYVKLEGKQVSHLINFRQFLTSKGYSALDLLVAGRAFTALAVISALLLAFPLIVRLAGARRSWQPY